MHILSNDFVVQIFEFSQKKNTSSSPCCIKKNTEDTSPSQELLLSSISEETLQWIYFTSIQNWDLTSFRKKCCFFLKATQPVKIMTITPWEQVHRTEVRIWLAYTASLSMLAVCSKRHLSQHVFWCQLPSTSQSWASSFKVPISFFSSLR